LFTSFHLNKLFYFGYYIDLQEVLTRVREHYNFLASPRTK